MPASMQVKLRKRASDEKASSNPSAASVAMSRPFSRKSWPRATIIHASMGSASR